GGAHRHHGAAAGLQRRTECAAGCHGAQQIHLDLADQVGLRRREQIPALDSARAGHQRVHASEGALDVGGNRGQSVGVGDVDVVTRLGRGTALRAFARVLVLRRVLVLLRALAFRIGLGRACRPARKAHDLVPVPSQVLAHRESYPAGPAGDHRHGPAIRIIPGNGTGRVPRLRLLILGARCHRLSSVAGSSNRAKCRSKCSLLGAFVSRLTTIRTATPTIAEGIAGCQPASGIGSHPMCRLRNSTSETSIEDTAPAVVALRQYRPASNEGKMRNTAGQVMATMIPMMLSGPKNATNRPPPTRMGSITRVVRVRVRSRAFADAPRPATGRTYSLATIELSVN